MERLNVPYQDESGKWCEDVLRPNCPTLPPIASCLKDVQYIDTIELGEGVGECFSCGLPVFTDSDHVKKDVYDSPWQETPTTILLHIDNNYLSDSYHISCEAALYDTSWADFRYFCCARCERIVIRQCPGNGWHSYVRTVGCEEICLKCYETDIYEHGLPREEFEKGRIPGMFFNRGELEKHGFTRCDVYHYVRIQSEKDAERFCNGVLGEIDKGYIVAIDYERMGIGGLEGYVTLWKKKGEK
jgi:hypothetical protein